jgi:hypothetical protein
MENAALKLQLQAQDKRLRQQDERLRQLEAVVLK